MFNRNDRIVPKRPISASGTFNGYEQGEHTPQEEKPLRTKFYRFGDDDQLVLVSEGDWDVKLTILDGEIISAAFEGFARRRGR